MTILILTDVKWAVPAVKFGENRILFRRSERELRTVLADVLIIMPGVSDEIAELGIQRLCSSLIRKIIDLRTA